MFFLYDSFIMSETNYICGLYFHFNKRQNYWQSWCCHAIRKQNTIVGRPSENRFTLESCWRVFFLILQFSLGCRQATPPRFVEQDAITAEKAILRLPLRIVVRETCFFSKGKWGGWSSTRGVGNECRTASGGWWVGLKLKNFWICDCERLLTRQTQSD